ncbi:MAG: Outer membrane TonB-dependent transporter, utilization system for glycans and polysaccharides (PUL), SusC family [uncultured Gemmatimonadaceae bacterium]|uniref:Outer membrane TonB-dependent transporter, utilization system for glycans and polysaccharides (PUL), SusC family n=1 Tax=uncultured Gemmatimonadaceae bacterium TaxID=246130 RepID=A0A6J4KSI1_9BACT|nr:MAG: Outer membrane TonB-dependent transporter, utilization system for glycans and polysaccharides (PUL), SusC family [uncultured Gemmatimonadaceae bacterium]
MSADSIPKGATQNLSQVLNGRAAGVTVLQSGGTTGTGARIRIRGANSVSLSNEPLLIIDGVRVNNNPSSNSIGVGGQSPSRLNDINPEDIENIEILKGPAASALYGTAAANGVVQVTTKRGAAGNTRWNAYAEGGAVRENNDYPPNFGGFGVFAGDEADGSVSGCDRITASFGDCTQDSVSSFNPLEQNSPFRNGSRQRYGLNASGGTQRTSYFLSGDHEEEKGVYVTSELDRNNLRANVRSELTRKLDATVTAGYLSSRLRLPQNDNNFLGYISNGLAGVSDPQTERSEANAEAGCAFRDGGYDPIGPCEINEIRTFQNVERFVGGVTSQFRPLSWLSFTGNAGYDAFNRFDNETFPAGAIDFSDLPEGSREGNRFQIRNWTGNIAGTATYGIREGIGGITSAGYQFQRELTEAVLAEGRVLAPGTSSLDALASRFAIGESYADNRTVGAFVSQQVSFADRVFATASLRGDDNSAFGTDFGFVYYPSANISWVIAEEPWFPKSSVLSSLRLRGAFGRNGLRPSNRDALRFFEATPARSASTELSGLNIVGLGLPGLKPEIITETEFGFDANFFSGRINTEVSYFNKNSKDALIARTTPASVGTITSRFENIGEVNNRGIEWLVGGAIVNNDAVKWNASVTGSTIRNELTKLGRDIPPIIFGLDAGQQHREGYALGGYWATPYTYEDTDGDGQIGFGEVTLGDSVSYLGNTIPKNQGALSSDITFRNLVRVSALLDYRTGYKLYNASESFRCGFFTCRGIQDPNAPLEEQAAAVAQVELGTFAGYVEDASFAKLREVAVTLFAPRAMAARFRTSDLSLTLSGRNLATFTDYTGLDPEVNSGGQANFSSFDFLSQPQVRYFTARLNLTF